MARSPAVPVATIRAMALLNTFQEALETGVLCIGPDVSQDQAREIERELGIFASQLPQLHRDLGTAPGLFATYHLRRWDDAAEPRHLQVLGVSNG